VDLGSRRSRWILEGQAAIDIEGIRGSADREGEEDRARALGTAVVGREGAGAPSVVAPAAGKERSWEG
jgi:hypothetical protein